jgi:flagellar biogenesis protein FliO
MNQALTTIAGVLLAALGAALVWTRRRAEHGPDPIRIVTSRHVGAKQVLTLVEVEGERLLIGVAGERVSLVARLGAGGPSAAAPEA